MSEVCGIGKMGKVVLRKIYIPPNTASLVGNKPFCTDVSSASDVQSRDRIIHMLKFPEMFHSTLPIFDIRAFCTNGFGIVKC